MKPKQSLIILGAGLLAQISMAAPDEVVGTYIGTAVVKTYNQKTDVVTKSRGPATFTLQANDSFTYADGLQSYSSSGTFGFKEGIFSRSDNFLITTVLLHFKGKKVYGEYTAGTGFGPGYHVKFKLKKQPNS